MLWSPLPFLFFVCILLVILGRSWPLFFEYCINNLEERHNHGQESLFLICHATILADIDRNLHLSTGFSWDPFFFVEKATCRLKTMRKGMLKIFWHRSSNSHSQYLFATVLYWLQGWCKVTFSPNGMFTSTGVKLHPLAPGPSTNSKFLVQICPSWCWIILANFKDLLSEGNICHRRNWGNIWRK